MQVIIAPKVLKPGMKVKNKTSEFICQARNTAWLSQMGATISYAALYPFSALGSQLYALCPQPNALLRCSPVLFDFLRHWAYIPYTALLYIRGTSF
jgi:hypothetical protein